MAKDQKQNKDKKNNKDRKPKKSKGGQKPISKKDLAKNLSQKKAPIPLTQKKQKKYAKHKVAVVFNEDERREYMAGFYGAAKRRKQEYIEKKKEKQKKLYKDHKVYVKKVKITLHSFTIDIFNCYGKVILSKVKSEQFERYRQIIEQNDKDLETLQLGMGFQKEKKEILTTNNDNQVEVVTEFL